jgi:hypothetical protein
MTKISFNEWLNIQYCKKYYNFDITHKIAKDLIEILFHNNINLAISEEEFIKKFQYFLYKRSITTNKRF